MFEASFSHPTPDGSREIKIPDGAKITFGRGSDAAERFADDGLSRLHATVYRDGERVWIVDENSANGTFINGVPANANGTPLKTGDSIRIGHQTIFQFRIHERAAAAAQTNLNPAGHYSPTPATESGTGRINAFPVILIGIAIAVVSLSAVLVAFALFAGADSNNDDPAANDIVKEESIEDEKPVNEEPRRSSSPKLVDAKPSESLEIPTIKVKPAETPVDILKGRIFSQLNEEEKTKYLREKAIRIASIIGNNSSDEIPDAALAKIQSFTNGYLKRLNSSSTNGCPTRRPWADNLNETFVRASKNAPFIVKAFTEKGVDARIGLYLAMIESEHCVCLQSSTGPLGMFQFTKATGEAHGLRTVKGASPDNPDERCDPDAAAKAAASYMKSLIGRYGTDSASVPLAIGSYNSGEGGLSSNLVKALESGSGLPREFWTLIANGEKLSKQFQAENFKYVPKFFAAAIIGEYPQDFGLKIRPLSTYTN